MSAGPYESLNLGLEGDDFDNIKENYRRFAQEVGFELEKLCIPYQEHTDKVLIVNDGPCLSKPFAGIDGFITRTPGIPIAVRFADCQGVLMYAPSKNVIAAVHSGWRGNAQNIIGKAVRSMVTNLDCDPSKILVGISQSLGPCHAEFSDPASELPEFMQRYVKNNHVDLWQCSLDQLTNEGVLAENVEIMRRCTVCENDKFFSYRASNGQYGHMAGVIQLL